MNQQQLNRILDNPANLNYEQDLPVIKEMIESFPYYAGSYIILTKLFHTEKSIYLDKYLKLSAAYIGDREVLYRYLHKQPEPAKEILQEASNAVIRENEPAVQNAVPEQTAV